MKPDSVLERFRQLVRDDKRDGRVRSLDSYLRLFHGHEAVIRPEYERLLDGSPTPPQPIDPPSSTAAILGTLSPSSGGLKREGQIARGGMGAIEKAHDDALNRDLAMKVMLPEREADAYYVHRFLEEAQVTAQLDHPGVVPVHQLGRDPEGRLYFTMKLVKGRTLSRIFDLVRARERNWTQTRVIELFIRICETLAFAHQKGVVHRDLKPANIMVGDFGELYVMDWGLAKVLGARAEPTEHQTPTDEPRSLVRTVRSGDTGSDEASPAATVVGDVIGTPAYMPVEQALGTALDARSDIYAVGAMLYDLFAGHPPYADKKRTAQDFVVAVVAGPPTPLKKLAPKLPAEILAICEKAMARDPADRYQTAGELAQELRNFIEGRVVRAYRTGALIELTKWVRRNKALAAAAGAALVLLVAGLVTNRSLYHEALRESERAQRQAYRAAIAAAASDIESNNLQAAAVRLDALPERLRGWEWRHLRSRVEPWLVHLPIQALGFDARTGRILYRDPERRLASYDLDTGATEQILPYDVLRTTADGHYGVARSGSGEAVIRDLRTGLLVAAGGQLDLDSWQPWLRKDGKTIDLATGQEVPGDAAAALSEELLRKGAVNMQMASVSPDRTRVAHLRDNTVALFDVATGARIGETVTLGDNYGGVAWSADGSRLAVNNWAGEVLLLDGATGRTDRTLRGPSERNHTVAFSPDGRLLVTAGRDGSRVWDVHADPEPNILRGHQAYVYPVGYSSDGRRIVSGGWDGHVKKLGSLRLWDAVTGKEIAATSRVQTVWWAGFLPDGRVLACFRDPKGMRLLDADTLEEIRTLGTCYYFSLSPDGTRIAAMCEDGGSGGRNRVIDPETGAVLAVLPQSDGGIDWGPRWIASGRRNGGDWGLGLWDGRTLKHEKDIRDTGPVAHIVSERNGRRVVIVDEMGRLATVFDTETGERLARLPCQEEVMCARFSPDGSRILLGSRDGAIHIWDTESYEEIVQLHGHKSYVFSLDFSPDGETLVSGSGDSTVRLWGTEPLRVRLRAIAEREPLVAELEPRVKTLFAELKDAKAVVARLRAELNGRRRDVALQLALAEAVSGREE